MAIDVQDVTNSDVAQIITGSEHINKMASSLTTNESIARLVEDFVINNIGSIAEKIADSIQLRNRSENQGIHNQITFFVNIYNISIILEKKYSSTISTMNLRQSHDVGNFNII